MQSKTTLLAKNTLFLYFRQILIMVVSLYTSRIILKVLGVNDYGIYNVVGGFVSLFSVISGSISVAISRFITLEVGKKNEPKIKEIFSTTILIQIAISIIVIILCECIGIWFIYNKMNISEERITASFWVMQCSLLTFVINLLSTPYNALIIAHEKMSAFAYISLLEVFLRLVIVIFLFKSPFDKLIVYAVLLAFISLIIRLVYSGYCKKFFSKEASFVLVFNSQLLAEMKKFIGWTFLGNGIIIIKDYGINILLNIFCGTVMNAARGIAGQVNSAVVSFVNNFMLAMNPQIIKSYAEKDFPTMHSLIIRGQKFSYFIMLVLFMIVVPNINYILKIWLIEVPPHTANLIILILLYSLTETYVGPLCTGVIAEGNIKNYEISVTIIYSLNFLLSYILLKNNFSVESVFSFNILFKGFICISLLISSYIKYSYPVRKFFIYCLLPTIAVTCICFVLTYMLHVYGACSFGKFIFQSFINFLITILVIIFVGLNKDERIVIKDILLKKIINKREIYNEKKY